MRDGADGETGNRAETPGKHRLVDFGAAARPTLRDAPPSRRSRNAANQGECRDEPEEFGLRGRMDWALASQNGVIAQAEFDDRARPNEMEFSGERSESAATTG